MKFKNTKLKVELERIGCPIRKGTELCYMSIKGKFDKYGNGKIVLSRKEHKKFGIGERQMQIIINDFRSFGIIKGEYTNKDRYYRKTIMYTVSDYIINIFTKMDTIWKKIKNLTGKIISKNATITYTDAVNLLAKFGIKLGKRLRIEEFEHDNDDRLQILIVEKRDRDIYSEDKYSNVFDFLKSKVSIPLIHLSHLYLK